MSLAINQQTDALQVETLHQGFANPISSSELCFRTILDAFAHPGTAYPINDDVAALGEIHKSTLAAMLTLLDFETALYIDNGLTNKALTDYIRFYCEAELVADSKAAQFALVSDKSIDLTQLYAGNVEYPDSSCTAIVNVTSNDRLPLTLSGPGINNIKTSELPLTKDFVSAWNSQHSQFPLGVDVLFCFTDSVIALPRTTFLTVR